ELLLNLLGISLHLSGLPLRQIGEARFSTYLRFCHPEVRINMSGERLLESKGAWHASALECTRDGTVRGERASKVMYLSLTTVGADGSRSQKFGEAAIRKTL